MKLPDKEKKQLSVGYFLERYMNGKANITEIMDFIELEYTNGYNKGFDEGINWARSRTY